MRSHFYLLGTKKSPKKLKKILKTDPHAWNLYKKAERQRLGSATLILPGGLLSGYELGKWTARGKINQQNLLIGAGAIGAGIWLSKGLHQKYKETVRRFNQSLTNKNNTSIAQFKIQASPTQIQLILIF